MNALHLDVMEDSSEEPLEETREEPPRESAVQVSQEHLTPDPDSSSDGLAMRPPTQWDPPGPQTP